MFISNMHRVISFYSKQAWNNERSLQIRISVYSKCPWNIKQLFRSTNEHGNLSKEQITLGVVQISLESTVLHALSHPLHFIVTRKSG